MISRAGGTGKLFRWSTASRAECARTEIQMRAPSSLTSPLAWDMLGAPGSVDDLVHGCDLPGHEQLVEAQAFVAHLKGRVKGVVDPDDLIAVDERPQAFLPGVQPVLP